MKALVSQEAEAAEAECQGELEEADAQLAELNAQLSSQAGAPVLPGKRPSITDDDITVIKISMEGLLFGVRIPHGFAFRDRVGSGADAATIVSPAHACALLVSQGPIKQKQHA